MKTLALCCLVALALAAQQPEFEVGAIKRNHSAERMDYGVRGSRLQESLPRQGRLTEGV